MYALNKGVIEGIGVLHVQSDMAFMVVNSKPVPTRQHAKELCTERGVVN